MTKKIKILIIIVAVIAIAVGGFFAYKALFPSENEASNADAKPRIMSLKTGDMNLVISANGTLESYETINIELDIDDGLYANVKSGDSVKKDDVIGYIDIDYLEEKLQEEKTTKESIQNDIDSLSNVYEYVYIKSPMDGYIRQSYLKMYSDIEKNMEKYGYIGYITADNLFNVIIPKDTANIENGMEVTISTEGHKYNTIITENENEYIAQFKNSYRKAGSDAQVLDKQGNIIYEGILEYNDAVEIIIDDGQVRSVYNMETTVEIVKNDDKTTTKIYSYEYDQERAYVSKGTILYKIKVDSKVLQDLYDLREEYIDSINLIDAYIKDNNIYAPVDGIITKINTTDYSSNSTFITMANTEQWKVTVLVDELDVNKVKIGQAANISTEAITGNFQGEVIWISALGINSSGITDYEVDIEIDGNSDFKIGMNITSEITIDGSVNAIMLPIAAYRKSGETEYVVIDVTRSDSEIEAVKKLVESGEYQIQLNDNGLSPFITNSLTDNDLIYGKVVLIDTGISNEQFIEVTSGLSGNEQVFMSEITSSTDELPVRIPGMGGGGGGGTGVPK